MKQIRFVGSSRSDLRDLPKEVRFEIGFALTQAANGEKSVSAKPMKGFKGASVIEIVSDYDGNTYRVVYTTQLPEAVYVLHSFQKKSKTGIGTPRKDIELIKSRLLTARKHSAEAGSGAQ